MLVDQFSRPIRSDPVPSRASWLSNGASPLEPVVYWGNTEDTRTRHDLARDIYSIVDQAKHDGMIADARYVYSALPSVCGAIGKFSDYAVGSSGWIPSYTGESKRFKARSADKLRDWLKVCNILGYPFDWATTWTTAAKCLLRDGEFFIAFINENGVPRLQFMEAHRVGTSLNKENVFCGVELDEASRPVAYYVRTKDAKNPIRIPSHQLIHCFDPAFFSQRRGIPPICNGLRDWYDSLDILKFEKQAVKINSEHAITESNETGYADPARQGYKSGQTVDPQVKVLAGGLIRYVKTGGKLESFSSNHPNTTWEGFMEHIYRGSFNGLGIPFEFAWDFSKAKGPGVRAVISQVQLRLDRLQEILWEVSLRSMEFAIATLFPGEDDKPDDWWMWEFSIPRKFSVDVGYDYKANESELRIGLTTPQDLYGYRSQDWKSKFRQRAEAISFARKAATDAGLKEEDSKFIYDPTATASQDSTEETPNEPEETEETES